MSEMPVLYSYEAEVWKSRVFLEQGAMLLDSARAPIAGDQDVDPTVDMRYGFSYRMQVGSSLLGAYPAERLTQTYARGNVKPFEGSEKRICSERINLGALNSTHFEVAGLAVVSSGDAAIVRSVEDASSVTVLPCRKACIPMLCESKRVIEDIPIITRDFEGRKSQAFTLMGLLAAYDDEEARLMNGAVSEFNFYRALQNYELMISRAERFRVRPVPAEVAIQALLETAY